MQSAIYHGEVFHCRLVPKKHAFRYHIYLLWLAVDEIDQLESKVRGFSTRAWSVLRFKREDYLGDPQHDLQHSVIEKMSLLAGKTLTGRVFMLGQTRTFGWYFSPVNFYYLQQPDGSFSHVLAEVSNTPWNERHHYLVDLALQQDSNKAFHVSPFNPMDMIYKWHIAQPAEQLKLSLSCHKQEKHFIASLNMTRQELNSANLLKQLLRIPSMTLKTLGGIYWQALKLLIKGMPIYSHPKQGKK